MSKGNKNDQGKAPLHMIPEESIIGMAEAFAFGAKKYDRFNYRKGLEYTRLTDSLRRHVLAFLNGEDIDPESGLHHTKHMLANVAMLEFMRIHRPEMDDRYKPEKKYNPIQQIIVPADMTVEVNSEGTAVVGKKMIETIKYYYHKIFSPLRLLLVFMFLPKHKFKASDLVYKDGTRTLYEVDSLYYNRNLEPIVIVRAYPNGSQLMGISYHEIKEFREFKKETRREINTTPSDVAMTAHDNHNFAKKGKK